MINALGLGMLFTARDMASGEMRRIEDNLRRLNGLTGTASAQFAGYKKTFVAGIASLGVGAVGLLAVGKTVQSAAELESAMVGVRKTTGMTSKELMGLTNTFLSMSTRIPVSSTELAGIAEIAGQLGIRGSKGLERFTEVTAKMTRITDLSAQDAATAFARIGIVAIKNFNPASDQTERLGSVLNELSNTSTASAGTLVDLIQRMGGAGKTFGLTVDQMAGIGATLTDMGVSAEVGGTAVSKFMTDAMTKTDKFAKVAGMSTADFKKSLDTNAIGTLKTLLTNLSKMDKFKRIETLQELGAQGSRAVDTLLKLSSGMGKLNKHLKTSNTAWIENTSMEKEFQIGTKSLNAQIKQFTNILDAIVKQLGYALLPVFTAVTQALQGFAMVFFNIPTPIKEFVMSLLAIGSAALVLLGIILILKGGFGMLSIWLAKAGVAGFRAFMLMIWQVLIPMAILTAAVIALKYVWDNNIGGMRDILVTFYNNVATICSALKMLFETGMIPTSLEKKLRMAGLWEITKTLFMFGSRIKEIFLGIWDGVKIAFDAILNTIVPMIQTAVTSIASMFGIVIKPGSNFVQMLNQIPLAKWREFGQFLGGTLLPAFLAFKSASAVMGFASMINGIVTSHRACVILFNVLTMLNKAFLFMRTIIMTSVIPALRILWLFLLANPWIVFIAGAIAAVTLIIIYWKPISAFFMWLWGEVVAYAQWAWNNILTTCDMVVSGLSDTWNGFVAIIGNVASAIIGFFMWIWNGAVTIWNMITATVMTSVSFWIAVIQSASYTIIGAVQSMGNALIGVWSNVSSFVQGIWNGIVGTVLSGINLIISAFYSVGSSVTAVFNGILSTVQSVVNSIVSAINSAKAGAASAGSAAAAGKKMQSGGLIPGRGSIDTVPIMATPGEVVIPKRTVQDVIRHKVPKPHENFNQGNKQMNNSVATNPIIEITSFLVVNDQTLAEAVERVQLNNILRAGAY